ncbi:zeta toxin family protein [Pseudomonas putida]|uniref:zeta toxin family protein n=1 Tax=Pseudomonas putida TaxID=303 RepID=UPI0037CBE375
MTTSNVPSETAPGAACKAKPELDSTQLLYPHTQADLDAAFQKLAATLLDKSRDAAGPDAWPSPKILILAGAQGSGKTYLLENRLLPSGRYANYVRLYLPSYRELHPAYEQLRNKSVLHIYQQTERFIWDLGRMLMTYALDNRYNIIMETALDSAEFVQFPPIAIGLKYQFEVHIIACQKEFSHWATLDRGVKSVAKREFDRFLSLSKLECSQGNARAILDAFEDACLARTGSSITMYHRGFETDMESQVLCHSRCENPESLVPHPDYNGAPFANVPHLDRTFSIERNPKANFPCSYLQYAEVVHAGMIAKETRQRMVQACCSTLQRAQAQMPNIPIEAFRELSLYVLKYIYP